MSYSRPPSKNAYGDTDFTSNDSLPQQETTSSLSSQLPSLQSQNYAPQSQDLQYPLTGIEGSDQRLSEAPSIKNLAASVTQEDILFMRRWQQDSFFKRVLPITAASSGILYFYNKQKNLPNKFNHFLGVSFISFIIGKLSYRGEFKRRLMESKLNTPYIQALRGAIGLPPVVADAGFDNITGFASSNYKFVDSSKGSSGFGPQQYPGGNLGHNPDYANQPATLDNQGLDTGKAGTSYEELRAKNRGYTR